MKCTGLSGLWYSRHIADDRSTSAWRRHTRPALIADNGFDWSAGPGFRYTLKCGRASWSPRSMPGADGADAIAYGGKPLIRLSGVNDFS